MSRFVALITVGDLGAAEVIVEALTNRGIESKCSRVLAEHPYQRSPLESVRILVPEELFAESNGVLAAVQVEVEHDFPAQSSVGEAGGPDELTPDLQGRANRRLSFAALWLGFLVPFPITCLCVGARLVGTVFLGVFIGNLVKVATFERGAAPTALLWWLIGAKVGDLVVALVIAVRRGRALSRSTKAAAN